MVKSSHLNYVGLVQYTNNRLERSMSNHSQFPTAILTACALLCLQTAEIAESKNQKKPIVIEIQSSFFVDDRSDEIALRRIYAQLLQNQRGRSGPDYRRQQKLSGAGGGSGASSGTASGKYKLSRSTT